jgi:hypothetical protein
MDPELRHNAILFVEWARVAISVVMVFAGLGSVLSSFFEWMPVIMSLLIGDIVLTLIPRDLRRAFFRIGGMSIRQQFRVFAGVTSDTENIRSARMAALVIWLIGSSLVAFSMFTNSSWF